MKDFFKDLVETITSIPFFGIIKSIFSGVFGIIAPIAFIAQIGLQYFSATHFLQLSTGGLVVVAGLLIMLHLFFGLAIAMLPMDMSPSPVCRTASNYIKFSVLTSLIWGGLGTLMIVGAASLATGATMSAFASTLALSSIGATIIHLLGVAWPVSRVWVSRERTVK